MFNIIYILLIVLLLLPLIPTAESKLEDALYKVTGGSIPRHKILPWIKIVLSAIMLFVSRGIITKICLIAIIVQNGIFLKRT